MIWAARITTASNGELSIRHVSSNEGRAESLLPVHAPITRADAWARAWRRHAPKLGQKVSRSNRVCHGYALVGA